MSKKIKTSSGPQVSAVITTFNRANLVSDAISSVLTQTFENFELLILDNGSTDGTQEAVATFSDKRIRYVRHTPMGISQQRNLALREAKSPFVAFLDDDDIWLPTKLEIQYEAISRMPGVSLVFGDYFFFNGVKKSKVFGSSQYSNYLSPLLSHADGFCGSASNPMLRVSDALAIGGYDETVGSGEDYFLYVSMAVDCQFWYLNTPVLAIRDHNGPRLIGKIDQRIELEEKILSLYNEKMTSEVEMFYKRKIAGKYIRDYKIAKGRKLLLGALRDASLLQSLKIVAQLGLSMFGTSAYSFIHNLLLRRQQRQLIFPFNPADPG